MNLLKNIVDYAAYIWVQFSFLHLTSAQNHMNYHYIFLVFPSIKKDQTAKMETADICMSLPSPCKERTIIHKRKGHHHVMKYKHRLLSLHCYFVNWIFFFSHLPCTCSEYLRIIQKRKCIPKHRFTLTL